MGMIETQAKSGKNCFQHKSVERVENRLAKAGLNVENTLKN